MDSSSQSIRSRQWTLVATILGSSLTFIDGTVVNVALPALQADLHATITDVQWVIEAYSLFLGGLLLVGGSLGDQFGRKRMFLVGVAVFTLASIACGLAPSIRALIAARAVQGVAAAFLVPGSLAIISATFEGPDRGRAIGTWSGFSAITASIGPVAGGWLIEHVNWRAAFFLNVPIAAVVILLSVRFMNESRDDSRTLAVDWPGAVLGVLGLGAVVFGLIEWPGTDANGSVVGWSLAVGVLSLIAFVVVESRAAAPMVPLGLFQSRVFTLANVLTLLLYGALATVFWLVPLNLIEVQHYSATAAGASLLPLPLLMFVLSRWSGGLVAKVGSRLPLALGPIVAAIGLVLFARPDIGGSYWATFFPAVAVLGLGMAIVVAPLTTTVMNAVEAGHAGVASGVNNAASRVAGLVAIAAFGIVLVRAFDARVGPVLDRMPLTVAGRSAVDRQLPKLASADVVSSVEPDHRTAIRHALDESFVSAFRRVMLTAAAVVLAAAAAGATIGDHGRQE
jgi:EmrB/QacA subfamily drug resistance transporter